MQLYKLKKEVTQQDVIKDSTKTESKKYTRQEVTHSKIILGGNVIKSGLAEQFEIVEGISQQNNFSQQKKSIALLGCLKRICDNITCMTDEERKKYFKKCYAIGVSTLKEKNNE